MPLFKTYAVVFHTALCRPISILIPALIATITSFIAITLLVNLPSVLSIFESLSLPWEQKILLISQIITHPTETFPSISLLVLSLFIAIFIGINTILTRYTVFITRKNPTHTVLIAGSVASNFLTISCVGCGQIGSGLIIQLIGTSAAIAFFTFQQIIFGILSIFLLSMLFMRLSKNIQIIHLSQTKNESALENQKNTSVL